MKENNENEREIEARVEFKINELFTGIKNTIKNNYIAALHSGSSKYYYYWEAFTIFENMIEKEIKMGVPYNEMAKQKLKEKRDKAVDDIMGRLCKKGSPDYHQKQKFVVNIVEKLLNI